MSGSITGVVWTDLNANGRWDAGDGRAAGWTVYMDLNHDGKLDAGDPTAITSSAGWYTFGNVAPGTYDVRYLTPSSLWHAAPYQPDHLTVTVLPGQDVSGQDIGVTSASGQISGTVEAGGAPAPHWGVYLDVNHNGRIDPGEPWTSTDANGSFSFPDLLPGTYTVRVDPLHGGWTPASPSSGAFTITSDGQHASNPVTFNYRPLVPAKYQVSQLVDYMLIGGGSSNAATRYVDPYALGNGWRTFITDRVQPDLAWGVRRIELHNPFGIGNEPIFRADQFLEAQAAGMSWLTDDFVNAWAPITRSGVEVIGYIGNPEYDPSFQALASDPAAWNARFNASVAPLVQAGMSIGFDLGQTVTPGDLFSQALDRLRAQGVKIYFENRPPEFAPYNLTFPVIAVNPGWDNTNPYVDPRQGWAAKNSEIQPDVMQLIQSPPAGISWTDKQWLLGTIHSILADGDSAAVSIGVLRQAGLTLNDVLTPVAPTVTGGQSPSNTSSTPTPIGNTTNSVGSASSKSASLQPVVKSTHNQGKAHHPAPKPRPQPKPKPHPAHSTHPRVPKDGHTKPQIANQTATQSQPIAYGLAPTSEAVVLLMTKLEP